MAAQPARRPRRAGKIARHAGDCQLTGAPVTVPEDALVRRYRRPATGSGAAARARTRVIHSA
jgi:hypothetical protein